MSDRTFLKNAKKFSNKDKYRIVLEGQSGDASIEEICLRERITPDIFYQWTQDYLENISDDLEVVQKRNYADDEKFRIVLDGLNGQYSVAEICRIEKITHDDFLAWSHEFMEAVKVRTSKSSRFNDREIVRKKSILYNYSQEVQDYLESFINLYATETI